MNLSDLQMDVDSFVAAPVHPHPLFLWLVLELRRADEFLLAKAEGPVTVRRSRQ